MTDADLARDVPEVLHLAPPSSYPVRWQRRASTQLLCVLALLVPMAVVAHRVATAQQGVVTLSELFVAPMVGGSALAFWILFLHLVVCGDAVDVFGFRGPRLAVDIALGAGLAVVLLVFHLAFGATVGRIMPPRPPAPQIVELIAGVARSPWLLALWLGPVVWIGVALFEELARVFLLRRLWSVWPGAMGRWIVIAVVSTLVGLVHAYQGAASMVCIGLQSILLGWVFLRTGRMRSLVVGHALYDSVQIVLAVIAIRQLGL